MTNQNAPGTLDEVASLYFHARGAAADEDWARSAAVRLVLDDVREPLIRESLFDLVPVLEEAREPAEVLFGNATDWAREQQAAWRSEGIPTPAPAGPQSLREFLYTALVGAAIAAPVFAMLQIFADGWTLDFTPGLVAFPLVLSLGIVGFLALWNWLVRRRARGAAIAIAGVALLGYSAAVAGALSVTEDDLLGRASGFWMLVVAAAYGLVAVLLRWIWPVPEPAEPESSDGPIMDDLTWKRTLAAHLRERGDITESRVATIIGDAERHSLESGRPVQEEFGSPASYAARFVPDEAVRTRRSAWGWTALALAPVVVFVLYGLDDGWHWQARFLVLALWFAGAAVGAVSRWRRAITHAPARG